jgi:hypothetical protein
MFIAAGISKLKAVRDALSAEAPALKQGLILAQTIGFDRIIVSSDCLEGGYSQDVAAALFDDCFHLVTEFLKV